MEGIATVAVVLLHSYANAAHEKRIAEILREEHPDAQVSLSAEVLPVLREYERSVVTLLNAYVMPVVSTYVEKLEQRADQQGISAPLLLMKSSGGVASTRAIRRTPVETALSGPAAGIVGAAFVAEQAGFDVFRQAFRQWGIPYRVGGGTGFFRRDEVGHLCHLPQAPASPV